MAQKFGNARWVKEGYFDNRIADIVVGQVTFAALGAVDFCLSGSLSGEISGKIIQFRNPKFLDDPYAGEMLEDFVIPQLGKVSLFSFDPHPLLSPHPYFEWFSLDQQHCRIELEPEDAWVMEETEWESIAETSHRIREACIRNLGTSAS
jgi:hypothetical protein